MPNNTMLFVIWDETDQFPRIIVRIWAARNDALLLLLEEKESQDTTYNTRSCVFEGSLE